MYGYAEPVKESSAQASSAARVRRRAAPYDLLTTGLLSQDAAHRQRIRGLQDRAAHLDPAAAPRRRTADELRDPRLRPVDEWLAARHRDVLPTEQELDTAEFRARR